MRDPFSDTQVVILAAGKGMRMNSSLPKVLVKLKGKPMISYLLENIKESKLILPPIIVVGYRADLVKKVCGNKCIYAMQKEQLGSGHAVVCARDKVPSQATNLLVLNGDMPLTSVATVNKLAEKHASERATLTMGTIETPDFDGWKKGFYDFGRIARDKTGNLLRIVEKKDASPSELRIREVNPSYFCFDANWLWQNFDQVGNDNSQKEYYLTTMLEIAIKQNKKIATLKIPVKEGLGVNTREQLKLVERFIV